MSNKVSRERSFVVDNNSGNLMGKRVNKITMVVTISLSDFGNWWPMKIDGEAVKDCWS